MITKNEDHDHKKNPASEVMWIMRESAGDIRHTDATTELAVAQDSFNRSPKPVSPQNAQLAITWEELRACGLDDSAVRDLRSDHAGEVGAVAIYNGILAVARDEELKRFALQHLATERQHLAFFDSLLPSTEQSRLLPVWRVAGFLTGAMPAVIGSRAVFVTIEAVENFVDEHYRLQIVELAAFPRLSALRDMLNRFRRDEAHHRDDASNRIDLPIGVIGHIWRWLVGAGSQVGVALAKRV